MTASIPPAALDASTVIASLGMTFTEAASSAAELVAQYDAIDGDTPEQDARRQDLYERLSTLNLAILTATPLTLADAVAVLDRLLCRYTGLPAGDTGREAAILHRVRGMLVQAIVALSAATETDTDFSAGVDALWSDAAPVLAIPVAPSLSMMEAGASAAGCSTDQFRAGFAAAVEALKLERAA